MDFDKLQYVVPKAGIKLVDILSYDSDMICWVSLLLCMYIVIKIPTTSQQLTKLLHNNNPKQSYIKIHKNIQINDNRLVRLRWARLDIYFQLWYYFITRIREEIISCENAVEGKNDEEETEVIGRFYEEIIID